jgi:hypothetical protein
LAKAARVCSPGEGERDGPLLCPKLLPVGAFGEDHVTQASNFDSGVQDAAEVMHRLAPSGSMSLSTSPIRPGEACSLCVPGVSGPQDCGLVYLVMSDPDLRDVSGCTIFALPRSDPSVEAQDSTRLIWWVIDPAKA